MGSKKNDLRTADRIRYAISRYKGIPIETDLSSYRELLEEIHAFDVACLPDRAIVDRMVELKSNLHMDRISKALPEVFALIGEAAIRGLGVEPFDVQILAGIVLHQGELAQMRTGEGKTLAAVFPAAMNALAGRGVHVFTANEYLAKRDALWMGAVYQRLGISVSFVQELMDTTAKRKAYSADITYLTAKQAGFDFLCDSIQYEPSRCVQRPFYMSVVDEADFIMVDEARIPLVIARETGPRGHDPKMIDLCVRALEREKDFVVDRNRRRCHLTQAGERRVEQILGCGGIHEQESIRDYAAVNVALHAHHLLTLDVDYIVKNGKIELVDEFTGRIAERRRWPYGIQTALEAKERVEIQREGTVIGSITVRHFLNLYPRIAAMTATAVSAAQELKKFYDLGTVIIPQNCRGAMVNLPDAVYRTQSSKLAAIIHEIEKTNATGRPVLVGTRSVKESQELSVLLQNRGIEHRVLNAKNDEEEAALIAKAGTFGSVTISTNMAGRGTDIKLGGPSGLRKEKIIALGGLYVIGTSRHESVRVDDQLRGRAGRQGDPGTSRFFISLEDDLIARYAITEFIPQSFLCPDGPEPIEDGMVAKEISRAQRIIENQHFEMRKTLNRYTELIERQRKELHSLRRDALFSALLPSELTYRCRNKISEISKEQDRERAITLLAFQFIRSIDDFWSNYLAWVDTVREGIHLRRLGRQDPLLEFIKDATEEFETGITTVTENSCGRFQKIDMTAAMREQTHIKTPSSTWTYLINDNPFPSFRISLLGNDIGIAAAGAARAVVVAVFLPVIACWTLAARLLRKLSRE